MLFGSLGNAEAQHVKLPDGKFTSNNKQVNYWLYRSDNQGDRPVAIVLPGSAGMLPGIASYAEEVAGLGHAVMIVEYLDSTSTRPEFMPDKEWIVDRDREKTTYVTAVYDALTELESLTAIDKSKISLHGFSLGGAVAVAVAMSDSQFGYDIDQVVNFFGAVGYVTPPDNYQDMPPIYIFHNSEDIVVPLDQSEELVSNMEQAGRQRNLDIFYNVYTGCQRQMDPPKLCHQLSDPDMKDAIMKVKSFLG